MSNGLLVGLILQIINQGLVSGLIFLMLIYQVILSFISGGLSGDLPTNTESEKVGVSRRVGAPSSFNWKEREGVTSIKNQGQCGSCWSFASAACAESHLILKGEYDFDEIDLS